MSRISKKLSSEIRSDAKNRCGYCLGEQKYILAWLEIEHISPRSKGGKNVRENLWLACTYCNTFKSSQTHGIDPKTKKLVALFNPRKQKWKKHFVVQTDTESINAAIPIINEEYSTGF